MLKKTGQTTLKRASIKRYLLKSISSITLFTFFITNLGYASPAEFAGQDGPAKISVANLSLPAEFGKLEEVYEGSSGRSVVLIQDAHCNFDAQNSIQKIIQHLQKESRLKLVAFEGATGELDVVPLKAFPGEDIRDAVLKDYARRGEVTGTELAAILSPFESFYYAIENPELYKKNLEAFLAVDGSRGAYETAVREISESAGRLRAKFYSEELLELTAKQEDYESNQAAALGFLRYLYERSLALSIDVKPFTLIESLMRRFESEKKLEDPSSEFSKAAVDFVHDAKTRLPRILSGEEKKTFHSRFQAYQTSRASAFEFLRYALDAASAAGITLKSSEAVSKELGGFDETKLRSAPNFFEELDSLVAAVKESLFKNEDQRKIDDLGARLKVIRSLSRLELSRRELAAYLADKSRYSPEAFRSMLALYGERSPDFDLSAAERFYGFAVQRDAALYKNLSLIMDGRREIFAAVIAGGFHADGIKAELRKNAVSYAVVSPVIKSVPGEELYLKVMRGEVSYLGKKPAEVADSPAVIEQLKKWRAEIINEALKKGKIAVSSEYTRYVDALFTAARKELSKSTLSPQAASLGANRVAFFGAVAGDLIEAFAERHRQDDLAGSISAMLDRMVADLGAKQTGAAGVQSQLARIEQVKAGVRTDIAQLREKLPQLVELQAQGQLTPERFGDLMLGINPGSADILQTAAALGAPADAAGRADLVEALTAKPLDALLQVKVDTAQRLLFDTAETQAIDRLLNDFEARYSRQTGQRLSERDRLAYRLSLLNDAIERKNVTGETSVAQAASLGKEGAPKGFSLGTLTRNTLIAGIASLLLTIGPIATKPSLAEPQEKPAAAVKAPAPLTAAELRAFEREQVKANLKPFLTIEEREGKLTLVPGRMIDATSHFPRDFMSSHDWSREGNLFLPTYTQPTAIAFYLELLNLIANDFDPGDRERHRVLETIVGKDKIADADFRRIQAAAILEGERVIAELKNAQRNFGYKGLVPWIDLANGRITSQRTEIAFLDNAKLTHSVAAFAGGLVRQYGKDAEKLPAYKSAIEFLDAQKEGYRAFYVRERGRSNFYGTYDVETKKFGTYKIDQLMAEHRAALAFVVTYFGRDDAVALKGRQNEWLENAWMDLGITKETVPVNTTAGRKEIEVLLPWAGLFEITWPRDIDNAVMERAAKNYIIAQAYKFSAADGTGFPASAAYHPLGGYVGDAGYPSLAQNKAVRPHVGHLQALLAGATIPGMREPILRYHHGVLKQFPQLQTPYGLANSIFFDAETGRYVVAPVVTSVDNMSAVVGLLGGTHHDANAFLGNLTYVDAEGKTKTLLQRRDGLYTTKAALADKARAIPALAATDAPFPDFPKFAAEKPKALVPRTSLNLALNESVRGSGWIHFPGLSTAPAAFPLDVNFNDLGSKGFRAAWIQAARPWNESSDRDTFLVVRMDKGEFSGTLEFRRPFGPELSKAVITAKDAQGLTEFSVRIPKGTDPIGVVALVWDRNTGNKGTFTVRSIGFSQTAVGKVIGEAKSLGSEGQEDLSLNDLMRRITEWGNQNGLAPNRGILVPDGQQVNPASVGIEFDFPRSGRREAAGKLGQLAGLLRAAYPQYDVSFDEIATRKQFLGGRLPGYGTEQAGLGTFLLQLNRRIEGRSAGVPEHELPDPFLRSAENADAWAVNDREILRSFVHYRFQRAERGAETIVTFATPRNALLPRPPSFVVKLPKMRFGAVAEADLAPSERFNPWNLFKRFVYFILNRYVRGDMGFFIKETLKRILARLRIISPIDRSTIETGNELYEELNPSHPFRTRVIPASIVEEIRPKFKGLTLGTKLVMSTAGFPLLIQEFVPEDRFLESRVIAHAAAEEYDQIRALIRGAFEFEIGFWSQGAADIDTGINILENLAVAEDGRFDLLDRGPFTQNRSRIEKFFKEKNEQREQIDAERPNHPTLRATINALIAAERPSKPVNSLAHRLSTFYEIVTNEARAEELADFFLSFVRTNFTFAKFNELAPPVVSPAAPEGFGPPAAPGGPQGASLGTATALTLKADFKGTEEDRVVRVGNTLDRLMRIINSKPVFMDTDHYIASISGEFFQGYRLDVSSYRPDIGEFQILLGDREENYYIFNQGEKIVRVSKNDFEINTVELELLRSLNGNELELDMSRVGGSQPFGVEFWDSWQNTEPYLAYQQSIHPLTADNVLRAIQQKGWDEVVVADIGAGDASFLQTFFETLQSSGLRVKATLLAFESSPESVRLARERIAREGLPIQVIETNVSEMELRRHTQGKPTIVTAIGLMNEWVMEENAARALPQRILRDLSPGDYLFLTGLSPPLVNSADLRGSGYVLHNQSVPARFAINDNPLRFLNLASPKLPAWLYIAEVPETPSAAGTDSAQRIETRPEPFTAASLGKGFDDFSSDIIDIVTERYGLEGRDFVSAMHLRGNISYRALERDRPLNEDDPVAGFGSYLVPTIDEMDDPDAKIYVAIGSKHISAANILGSGVVRNYLQIPGSSIVDGAGMSKHGEYVVLQLPAKAGWARMLLQYANIEIVQTEDRELEETLRASALSKVPSESALEALRDPIRDIPDFFTASFRAATSQGRLRDTNAIDRAMKLIHAYFRIPMSKYYADIRMDEYPEQIEIAPNQYQRAVSELLSYSEYQDLRNGWYYANMKGPRADFDTDPIRLSHYFDQESRRLSGAYTSERIPARPLPTFGQMLAEHAFGLWRRLRADGFLGPDEEFTIGEAGAGIGIPAADILAFAAFKALKDQDSEWAEFFKQLTYRIYERSPQLIVKQRENILATLQLFIGKVEAEQIVGTKLVHEETAVADATKAEQKYKGFIFSNELLDDLAGQKIRVSPDMSARAALLIPHLPRSELPEMDNGIAQRYEAESRELISRYGLKDDGRLYFKGTSYLQVRQIIFSGTYQPYHDPFGYTEAYIDAHQLPDIAEYLNAHGPKIRESVADHGLAIYDYPKSGSYREFFDFVSSSFDFAITVDYGGNIPYLFDPRYTPHARFYPDKEPNQGVYEFPNNLTNDVNFTDFARVGTQFGFETIAYGYQDVLTHGTSVGQFEEFADRSSDQRSAVRQFFSQDRRFMAIVQRRSDSPYPAEFADISTEESIAFLNQTRSQVSTPQERVEQFPNVSLPSDTGASLGVAESLLANGVELRDFNPDHFAQMSAVDQTLLVRTLTSDLRDQAVIQALRDDSNGRFELDLSKFQDVGADTVTEEGRTVYLRLIDPLRIGDQIITVLRFKGVRPILDETGEVAPYEWGSRGQVRRPLAVLDSGDLQVRSPDNIPAGTMTEEAARNEFNAMKESEGAQHFETDAALAWGLLNNKQFKAEPGEAAAPVAFVIAGMTDEDYRMDLLKLAKEGDEGQIRKAHYSKTYPPQVNVPYDQLSLASGLSAAEIYKKIGRAFREFHDRGLFHGYPYTRNIGLKELQNQISVIIRDLDPAVRKTVETNWSPQKELGYRFLDIERLIYDIMKPAINKVWYEDDYDYYYYAPRNLVRSLLEGYFHDVSHDSADFDAMVRQLQRRQGAEDAENNFAFPVRINGVVGSDAFGAGQLKLAAEDPDYGRLVAAIKGITGASLGVAQDLAARNVDLREFNEEVLEFLSRDDKDLLIRILTSDLRDTTVSESLRTISNGRFHIDTTTEEMEGVPEGRTAYLRLQSPIVIEGQILEVLRFKGVRPLADDAGVIVPYAPGSRGYVERPLEVRDDGDVHVKPVQIAPTGSMLESRAMNEYLTMKEAEGAEHYYVDFPVAWGVYADKEFAPGGQAPQRTAFVIAAMNGEDFRLNIEKKIAGNGVAAEARSQQYSGLNIVRPLQSGMQAEQVFSRIGRAFRELHDRGIYHTYPHYGNIGLYDSQAALAVVLRDLDAAIRRSADTNWTAAKEVAARFLDLERLVHDIVSPVLDEAGTSVYAPTQLVRPLLEGYFHDLPRDAAFDALIEQLTKRTYADEAIDAGKENTYFFTFFERVQRVISDEFHNRDSFPMNVADPDYGRLVAAIRNVTPGAQAASLGSVVQHPHHGRMLDVLRARQTPVKAVVNFDPHDDIQRWYQIAIPADREAAWASDALREGLMEYYVQVPPKFPGLQAERPRIWAYRQAGFLPWKSVVELTGKEYEKALAEIRGAETVLTVDADAYSFQDINIYQVGMPITTIYHVEPADFHLRTADLTEFIQSHGLKIVDPIHLSRSDAQGEWEHLTRWVTPEADDTYMGALSAHLSQDVPVAASLGQSKPPEKIGDFTNWKAVRDAYIDLETEGRVHGFAFVRVPKRLDLSSLADRAEGNLITLNSPDGGPYKGFEGVVELTKAFGFIEGTQDIALRQAIQRGEFTLYVVHPDYRDEPVAVFAYRGASLGQEQENLNHFILHVLANRYPELRNIESFNRGYDPAAATAFLLDSRENWGTVLADLETFLIGELDGLADRIRASDPQLDLIRSILNEGLNERVRNDLLAYFMRAAGTEVSQSRLEQIVNELSAAVGSAAAQSYREATREGVVDAMSRAGLSDSEYDGAFISWASQNAITVNLLAPSPADANRNLAMAMDIQSLPAGQDAEIIMNLLPLLGPEGRIVLTFPRTSREAAKRVQNIMSMAAKTLNAAERSKLIRYPYVGPLPVSDIDRKLNETKQGRRLMIFTGDQIRANVDGLGKSRTREIYSYDGTAPKVLASPVFSLILSADSSAALIERFPDIAQKEMDLGNGVIVVSFNLEALVTALAEQMKAADKLDKAA